MKVIKVTSFIDWLVFKFIFAVLGLELRVLHLLYHLSYSASPNITEALKKDEW
jgi:hypothetical protein